MPIFTSSEPVCTPGKDRSTMKAEKPAALQIGEHDEGIGPPGVGNEHFLPVHHIVGPVRTRDRFGAAPADGIGAGAGFGKGEKRLWRRPTPGPEGIYLSARRFRKTRWAESRSRWCPPRITEKRTGAPQLFRHHDTRDLVQTQTAEGFGHVNGEKTQLSRLAQESDDGFLHPWYRCGPNGEAVLCVRNPGLSFGSSDVRR